MGQGTIMRRNIQRLLTATLTALAVIFAAGPLRAQTYAPPSAGDYGANGSNAVYVSTFTNPVYPTANGTTLVVSVYHPGSSINTNLPTVFVAHGFTSPAGSASDYAALLTNLASRGYNAVFSPYEGGNTLLYTTKRFDELVTGFEAAVTNYHLATDRVGFVGHSYGGGFLPALIQYAMLGKSSAYRAGHAWGGSAAFFFSMAPSFALDGGGQTSVSGTQHIVFPTNLNVIEESYFDDTSIVDPRLALDIFYNITTRNSQKEFITVYSDNHGTPAQLASHFLPNTAVAMTSTSLQSWAVFRHLDALAAWTFAGDTNAQVRALGNGVAAETWNGAWSDSVPVVPLGITDLPAPGSYSTGPYLTPWNSAANPRGAYPLFSGPPRITAMGVATGKCWMATTNLLGNHAYAVQSTVDLSSNNWDIATNFTPTQTSLTLTNSITNATRQFWRVLAP